MAQVLLQFATSLHHSDEACCVGEASLVLGDNVFLFLLVVPVTPLPKEKEAVDIAF